MVISISPFLIPSPIRLKSLGPPILSLVIGSRKSLATKDDFGLDLAYLIASSAIVSVISVLSFGTVGVITESTCFGWGIAGISFTLLDTPSHSAFLYNFTTA